jgi:hypothetical protein
MTHFTALRAKELSNRFGVYGRFYRTLLGGVEYSCRSVLELVERDAVATTDLQALDRHPPDLHVVMMNPGSSHPVPVETPIVLIDSFAEIEKIPLVPTRPDNTQYQIMKIMVARGYRHARVVNLSDLREPKSPLFLGLVERLRGVPGGERHSLFCDARREALHRILVPSPEVPVLVGWGRHVGLKGLAQQCLEKLADRVLVGVPVVGEPVLFAHPSPMLQSMKDAWIAAVLNHPAIGR